MAIGKYFKVCFFFYQKYIFLIFDHYFFKYRTEEEFERLHAESQIQSKTKAMSNVQQKRNIISSKSKISRPVKNAKTTNSTEVVSGSMIAEEEADTEDVNVDVETSEIPVIPTANVLSSVTTTTTTIVQSQPVEKVLLFSNIR